MSRLHGTARTTIRIVSDTSALSLLVMTGCYLTCASPTQCSRQHQVLVYNLCGSVCTSVCLVCDTFISYNRWYRLRVAMEDDDTDAESPVGDDRDVECTRCPCPHDIHSSLVLAYVVLLLALFLPFLTVYGDHGRNTKTVLPKFFFRTSLIRRCYPPFWI